MPKDLERKLRKLASKKFPGDKKRQDKYVYGSEVMKKYLRRKNA